MNDMIAVVKENNISNDFAGRLQSSFTPYFDEARKIADNAKKIVVTSEDQKDLMKQARDERLRLKNIRVEVEHKRRELKEESLRTGKAIDGMANVIKFLIAPIEEHLQLQEDFLKIQEERAKAELADKRAKELEKYEVMTEDYDLRNMAQPAYDQLLENSKVAYEHRKDLEKKEEQERIEAEKKRLEEEKKIRAENEKLKKEALERERLEKIEADRRAKERAVFEGKLKKEAEARKKLEDEARAKKEAEEKAKQEEERKQKEEELAQLKAEKEARLAPDKEKMRIAYKAIQEISTDIKELGFVSDEARKIADQAIQELNQVTNNMAERMKNL